LQYLREIGQSDELNTRVIVSVNHAKAVVIIESQIELLKDETCHNHVSNDLQFEKGTLVDDFSIYRNEDTLQSS
jgi:hypothetical protein